MKKRLLLLSVSVLAFTAGSASADPVTAAIGLALGGGATALAIAQVIVGLGINLIAGAATKALAGKPKINVNFEAQIGDDLPLSFVVGDYVTAGKRKYVGSWGPNTRYVVEVFEVSALPQPGTPEIWINDEPGTVLWGETATFTDRVVSGREQRERDGHSGGGFYYVNTYTTKTTTLGNPITNFKAGPTDYRMWIKWVDGNQTVVDPYLKAVFGSHPDHPWTDAMVGKGKTYAIITTQYDADTMTQVPQVLFKPAPLPMYDPRKDSTVGGIGAHRWGTPSTYEPSRNNAVIAYNLARGIYYGSEWVFGGQNLAAWRLPQYEWAVAMNACDALISLADSSTEPSYRGGAEVTVDMEPLAVMEQLGAAANMRYAEVGGRIKPLVGLPAVSVFTITDGDLVVTSGQTLQPFAPLAQTFNSITATYPEPAQRWKNKDAPERQISGWLARDGQYLPMAVNYAAAPYKFQVQRLMQAQLLDAQRAIVHEFALPPMAYAVEPFDMITWSSDRNGYVNKTFLVEAVTKLVGMGVQVVLKEVDPTDYDWAPAQQLPAVVVPPTVAIPVYEVVTSFTATGVIEQDNASTARVAGIAVTCSGDIAGVDRVRIQARKVGIDDPVLDVIRPFGAPYRWVSTGVAPATTYLVRIMPLTPYATGEWTAELTVTTPNILVPRAGLATDILTQIDANIANTDAASLKLAQLTNGLITDIDGALLSIENRTRAGMKGWLTDPIFSRFVSGNLTVTNWWSRSGITVYGSQVVGLLGTALSIDVPTGSGVVQFIARSDLETNGMRGADPDAPFVVVVSQIEYISGDLSNTALRPEWSNDLTNWTRGDLQGQANSAGSFTQLGYGAKPGVVQAFETLWKRPAGTFAHVRLVANPKTSTVTTPTKQVWHLVQIRKATEAEVSAWTIPTMQSTIDIQAATITGLGDTTATLSTTLTSTTATANSKGKVIVQSATPAVGDRLPQNLWIDTTGGNNTPKMWSGAAWVQVTDKVASDAATAAAAAQGTADDVTADLATNYLTTVNTNSAIAAAKLILSAALRPYQTIKMHSDFLENDAYWATSYTQDASALAAASPPTAYPDVFLVTSGVGQVIQCSGATANRNISERLHRQFVAGQKLRFRIRTRLTVNPTSGVHSHRVYITMQDQNGIYLGFTAVAAFSGLVVAAGWVTREVIFDPSDFKGVYTTAVTFRLFFQLAGITGATHQVAWVELEDVTFEKSTDELFADVVDIKAVSVSGLTGTALGTLLTQLAVDAGGTSAFLTTQGEAVADLEGNATASLVFRVGAGGASAGVELVAADNPITGPASTLKLAAKHIEILASSVRISDTANLYPDFDMLDPDFYTSINGAVVVFPDTAVATLGRKYLNIGSNAALRSAQSGWFNIEPSTEYLVTAAAFMSGAAAGSGTCTVTFEQASVDASGVITTLTPGVTVTVGTRTDNTNTASLSVSVISAASARRGRFVITRAAGGTAAARAGGFKVQKKAKSVLIANGAVIASHVDTTSFAASGLAIFGGTLQSANYAESGGVPTDGFQLTQAGTFKGKNIILREAILSGAVSDKLYIVAPGPFPVPGAQFTPILTLTLGTTLNGEIRKYGFAWKTFRASGAFDVVCQVRFKYLGVWGGWVTRTRTEVLNGVYLSDGSSATLAGAYEDAELRLSTDAAGTTGSAMIKDLSIVSINLVK